MRPNPVFTTLLLICISVLWVIRKDLVRDADAPGPAKPKNVELAGVRVRSFQGLRVLDLRGKSVITDEKDTRMDLQPVEGTITEDDAVAMRFRAGKGRKELTTAAGELLQFREDVYAETQDGYKLETDELFYYPRSGKVESPVPSTLVTTDTRISGDRFESSIQMRTGVVTGHVVITSTRFPGSEGTPLPSATAAPRRIPYRDLPPWTAPKKKGGRK